MCLGFLIHSEVRATLNQHCEYEGVELRRAFSVVLQADEFYREDQEKEGEK